MWNNLFQKSLGAISGRTFSRPWFNPTIDTLFEIDTLDHLGDYIMLAMEKRRENKLLDNLPTNAVLTTPKLS